MWRPPRSDCGPRENRSFREDLSTLTPDAATFAAQAAAARLVAGARPLWAGIGAYRLSSAQTIERITTARRLGAGGIVLFSYDSLTNPPNGVDYLSQVGRAAFGQ